MSQNITDPVVITSVPETEEETSATKQSLANRAWNGVKKHKKPVIATVGLVSLVVVSAAFGRKTAPDADVFLLELESPEETDDEIVESTDTTVA